MEFMIHEPPTEVMPDPEEQPTMSVPDAGRIAFGLNPTQSYDMAKRGDLPVIFTSRCRMRVPTMALRLKLGLEPRPQRLPVDASALTVTTPPRS
jgi:hypothetical protein